MIVEEGCLLGCCALWYGNLFPTFRRNRLHIQGYESTGLINPEDGGGTFFETSGSSYPTTRRNNPKDMLPHN